MTSRRRSTKHTTDLIMLMGKLMVFWSIFLLLFEAVDWLGVTKSSLRALDELAMLITLALLVTSTLGVRLAVRYMRHRQAKALESSKF